MLSVNKYCISYYIMQYINITLHSSLYIFRLILRPQLILIVCRSVSIPFLGTGGTTLLTLPIESINPSEMLPNSGLFDLLFAPFPIYFPSISSIISFLSYFPADLMSLRVLWSGCWVCITTSTLLVSGEGTNLTCIDARSSFPKYGF